MTLGHRWLQTILGGYWGTIGPLHQSRCEEDCGSITSGVRVLDGRVCVRIGGFRGVIVKVMDCLRRCQCREVVGQSALGDLKWEPPWLVVGLKGEIEIISHRIENS
ncbi:hypothetical protein TNCT_470421 [Trichonephila clavata]|uniref:Uncharacterized protein n=1 Tax=Trichonephila clavata TaxID=2740835 RepID=A0A8X6IR08_TRICU|nr:hypothetical protein TNCT_470421 [Trichonephila clavata]